MNRQKKQIITAAWMLAAMTTLTVGCQRETLPPGQQTTTTTAAATTPAAVSTPATPTTAGAKVTKVVFIGKKDACDCTRTRVDESLAALQSALAGRTDIAVEQLQQDVDQAKVAQFEQLRALMVLPGIYLLDESGSLIDVLQGEVTAERLRAALGEG